MSAATISNYKNTFRHLSNFSKDKKFVLRIKEVSFMTKKQHFKEKKYWDNFDFRFGSFLYANKLNDNSARLVMKQLKSFFKYLKSEKGINAGDYHKSFFMPNEHDKSFFLSQEKLAFLIFSKSLENNLSTVLKRVKDVFVFGCITGLRYSDLMKLTKNDIETNFEKTYLHLRSSNTKILLPSFAVSILDKYTEWRKSNTLLPFFWLQNFNKHIQKIGEIAGWIEPSPQEQYVQGELKTIYADSKKRKHPRYCDLITSDTMHRTAVYSMTIQGMDEQLVKKISGYKPYSDMFSEKTKFINPIFTSQLDKIVDQWNEEHNPSRDETGEPYD